MTNLTIEQLRTLAAKVGFTGDDINIAAAVAMAESSGNPGALGDVTLQDDKWGPSYGLFQIRSLKRPNDYGRPDNLRIADKLSDAEYNAKVAASIKADGGWKLWSTYMDGAYKKYMPQATITPVKETKPVTAKAIYFNHVWKGTTNQTIKSVQEALNKAGAKLVLDGNYGPKTAAAVKAFQKAKKLTQDGIAGPITLKALGFVDKPDPKATATNYEKLRAPVSNYTVGTLRGVKVNERTKVLLERAEDIFGKQFGLTQGGYNKGGVAASAGTHDGGGALDISVRGMSQAQINKAVLALRKAGFAAWHRTPAQGFVPHIHAIAIGDKEASLGAKSQVQSYFNKRDGLAYNRADNTEHRWPDWCDKYNR